MEFHSKRAKKYFDRLSHSRHMYWLLFLFSFLETIIVPIPIEVILIPLMAKNREKIWQLATVTLLGCLAASLIGYAVGHLFFQSVGVWFIQMMGYEQAHESFKQFFDHHGFWAILIVGIVPIPFQIAMITAGMAGYSITLFVLAAVIARGIRYYGLAFLVKKYGKQARDLWSNHALLFSLGIGGGLLVLYLALQWIANTIM